MNIAKIDSHHARVHELNLILAMLSQTHKTSAHHAIRDSSQFHIVTEENKACASSLLFLSDGESTYSSGLRSLRTPRHKKLRNLTPLGIQVDRSTRTSTERGRDFTRHPVGRIALARHPFNPEAHPGFCENTVATRPFRSRSLSQSYSHS